MLPIYTTTLQLSNIKHYNNRASSIHIIQRSVFPSPEDNLTTQFASVLLLELEAAAAAVIRAAAVEDS